MTESSFTPCTCPFSCLTGRKTPNYLLTLLLPFSSPPHTPTHTHTEPFTLPSSSESVSESSLSPCTCPFSCADCRAHTITAVSAPPVDTSLRPSWVQRTLVTCALWPGYFLNLANLPWRKHRKVRQGLLWFFRFVQGIKNAGKRDANTMAEASWHKMSLQKGPRWKLTWAGYHAKRHEHNSWGFLVQNIIAERSTLTAYIGRIPCKETRTQQLRLPGAKCHHRKVHIDSKPGQDTLQRDTNTMTEVLLLQKGSCWQLTLAGYRKSLTKPKSSAVARKRRSGDSEAALTSVTSLLGGHTPSHVGPSTQVQVDQSNFSISGARSVIRFPLGASKKSCSLAPVLTMRTLPLASQSTWVM